MNKEELKEHIIDMVMLDPWDIDELIAGEYSIKETQEIWNNLKQESKDLIKTYVLAFYDYTIVAIDFSTLFDTIFDYEFMND